MIQISIEGQSFELPPEIAVSDDAIKRAMAPIFPQITTAQFQRISDPSGTTIIKVTKRAGDKGNLNEIIQHLKKAPRHVNPIFPLYDTIYLNKRKRFSAETFFTVQQRLERALTDGQTEIKAVQEIRRRLEEAPGTPSSQSPIGF
jgi:hypothetical protein